MHVTTEILEACVQNDRRAQKQLYECCYKSLLSLCLRYYSNAEDARFVFNNGFLKIINGLAGVNLQEINFAAWSKRVMTNVLIDEYRRNKNHDSMIFSKETDRELELSATNNSNEGEEGMNYEAIMGLLKTIPQISAHVFTLYVIDGYNHKEIGEMLDITEGTSKWHLSTARKHLRDRLESLDKINEKRFAI